MLTNACVYCKILIGLFHLPEISNSFSDKNKKGTIKLFYIINRNPFSMTTLFIHRLSLLCLVCFDNKRELYHFLVMMKYEHSYRNDLLIA